MPSGRIRAVGATPISEFAPGRFTVTTGTPSVRFSTGAGAGAEMSLPPPDG
jgi:hypothetical protein